MNKKLNIWETSFEYICIFLTNIEELLKYIKDNNTSNLTIHETYNPKNQQKCIFDRWASRRKISLTYTDKEHPITIINLEDVEHNILINPEFFNQHKDILKEETKKIILEKLKETTNKIHIPDFIIDNEIINILCNNNNLSKTNIYIDNIINLTLTKEQINKFKQSHLEVFHNRKKISTKYLINNYTIKDLQAQDSLSFDKFPNIKKINNFIYINENCIIDFSKASDDYDELKYLSNLNKIFKILNEHNRTYNIKISINNRELLKQSNILNYNNINLTITNDLYDYQKEEYLKEEEQLDKLIEPIKNANLSPYEKYIAVYNIVKNFKPYKENENNLVTSRYLRYILNNEYIVCVGYSTLLTTLLDKVGIPSMKISVGVDTSYDSGFTKEDKPTNIEGHTRNIIKIDDDKYNIHGIFVADSTWDNDLEKDLYNNSAMTFNRKKEAKRLEQLTYDDLLLDFNNLKEFKEKINFYLRRNIKKSLSTKTYQEKLIEAYQNIYKEITERLSILDYDKYKELQNKYQTIINDKIIGYHIDKNSIKEIDEIFSDFLTEYASYILPLTNKKIDDNTVLTAIMSVKETLRKNEINDLEQIEKTYKQREEKAFPYIYDPNNPIPNYLESKETSKKR